MSVSVLRHSARDGILVALALAYGAVLLARPSAPLVAVGIWWVANTVSHNFIHLPFFRSRSGNALFSAYLSLLLGVPQTLWRDRHIAHHADRPWRMLWSSSMYRELALVIALWTSMALLNVHFFLATWVTGWVTAMLLCWLQGYYEHVRGTVSHYGMLYNFAFFNDGYHVEHHARPGVHWAALPLTTDRTRVPVSRRSRWPAVLRWLEVVHLNTLERIVLRSRVLQDFVVDRHSYAMAPLIQGVPSLRRVSIVGGGLFPRSALVVRRLIPGASIQVIDMSGENIARAKHFVRERISWMESRFDSSLCAECDLLVVPLAFHGDRASFYNDPPAPVVLVHDWIWNRVGEGRVVSPLLLKRINIVRR